ncbi:MAG: TlpA disulfide reductase family protein [Steroidobacteraceae bacterium]
MKMLLKAAALAALLTTTATAFADPAVTGRWDAQLLRAGNAVPFRLDITGSGATLQGTLYDGFRPNERTTRASFRDGKLELYLEHYLTTITATLADGKLVGSVAAKGRSSTSEFGFAAARHDASAAARLAQVKAPDVGGSWYIPLDTPNKRGEQTVRFSVEQRGAEIAGSVLRVDGDTGAYSGVYRNGKWELSHWDGSRPGVITVTPLPNGTLEIRERNDRADARPEERWGAAQVAYRPDAALAKGYKLPTDHLAYTSTRDTQPRFTFSFPDVNGRLVTQDDPYFAGKPVLAIVTGTWCPNCHDEAQYLVQLYKKYGPQGLAIVALDFEEVDQQESLQRARAFIKQYGVEYPYLIAGTPEELGEKVPQLVNLDTFPASIFIGRDGTVRAIHAGFASLATGEFRARQDREFVARIEALLKEKPPVERVSQNTR